MCWDGPISRCLPADWALVCQIQGIDTFLSSLLPSVAVLQELGQILPIIALENP